MCELLGMSANVPTDICFSFSGLIKRGGKTGPHKDGWGITFYEGRGCRTFKDPQPGCVSPIANFVKQYPIKSCAIISHIRQANRGEVTLENTHPFTRELWGQNWTFAHNGQLKGYKQLPIGQYRPIGQTDSEYAFCWLLHQLSSHYRRKPVNWKSVFLFVTACVNKLHTKGVFNILLTNGEYVYAYCSTHLHCITRKAPFGRAKLLDDDIEIDFQHETSASDVVSIIATQPLTFNEQWTKIEPGHAVLFHLGEQVISF